MGTTLSAGGDTLARGRSDVTRYRPHEAGLRKQLQTEVFARKHPREVLELEVRQLAVGKREVVELALDEREVRQLEGDER